MERLSGQPVGPRDEPLRPFARWWVASIVVVMVLVFGGAAAMWLLGVWSLTPVGSPDPDRLRLDRIKTGLTVAAGLAAGATLLMTLRRQAWSERAQRFAESDALEQRTTALYVAAADQLGSDKAPVRLAGLYVLERLGQETPKLRQTVFDVWCAYLRMPYTPPVEVLRRNAEHSPERPTSGAELPDRAIEAERRQELEVRLTAQRLLAAHLSVDPAKAGINAHWRTGEGRPLTIGLDGAVLVNFAMYAGLIGHASFNGAHFHGTSNLSDAQFQGDVFLSEAEFHGTVYLAGVRCSGYASLCGVQFYGPVYMGEAEFHGTADLSGGQFHDGVGLAGTQFYGDAYLKDLQVHGIVALSGAEVHGYALLLRSQFHGDVDLSGVQFHDTADLSGAQFHGAADLSGARFHCDAYLSRAQFAGDVDMTGAAVSSVGDLPNGWVLGAATSDASWLRLVVRARDVLTESNDPNAMT